MALSQGNLILASDVYKSIGTYANASEINATQGAYITVTDLKKQVQDIDYLEFRLTDLAQTVWNATAEQVEYTYVSSLSEVSGYGTLSITNNSNGTSGKAVVQVNTSQHMNKGIFATFGCYAHFKSNSSRVVGDKKLLSNLAHGMYDSLITYNINVTGSVSHHRYSGSGSWTINIRELTFFIDEMYSEHDFSTNLVFLVIVENPLIQ